MSMYCGEPEFGSHGHIVLVKYQSNEEGIHL